MNGRQGVQGDREWMAQALALAALAEGSTRPNPRVGCVLVADGEVVGRGVHRQAGLPHAEAMAVDEAGSRAAGATLYVNLEPCAHHGRTPPCVELLARHGVSRVVAAMRDPDPRVDGAGFAGLRHAGIEVDDGILEAQALELNAGFVHWHRTGRPLVTLKAALSTDGRIAAAGGRSRWISNATSRRFAHRLRARHDAVLVGAGTVRRDDPRLDVRIEGAREPRLRVVISRELDLDPRCRLFQEPESGPVRIYTSPRADAERRRRLEPLATLVDLEPRGEWLDPLAVLDDLGRSGVQTVLVEGGGEVLARFVEAGLAARVALFTTPRLLGAVGATPLVSTPAVARPADGPSLRRDGVVALGEDLLWLGRLESRQPAEPPCSPD